MPCLALMSSPIRGIVNEVKYNSTNIKQKLTSYLFRTHTFTSSDTFESSHTKMTVITPKKGFTLNSRNLQRTEMIRAESGYCPTQGVNLTK